MKFILGKKIEMTQKFAADGTVIPVTAVLAAPCFVTQVKSKEVDGYKSLQIGCGQKKKLTKPLAGHLKDLAKLAYLREFRLADDDKSIFKKGQKITVAIFQNGDVVKVSGTSKGRGFQGVVKRHGFHGHFETHGTKDAVRAPGAIGAGGPQHVFKGMRMAGRMGGEPASIANLEIVEIDLEKNILYIKGAIPGSRNSLIEIIAPGEMKLVEEVATPEVNDVKTEEVAPEPVKEEVAAEPVVISEEKK